MTSNYHTPIPDGSAANAATFNNPLGQMDEALSEALLAERDGHIIQDEGVDLAQQPRIDFVGAGVTVTNTPGKTVVTIPFSGDHGDLSGLGDDDHPQYLLLTALPNYIDTYIKGMKAIWNSGTSISVDIGSCFAENGDFIQASSVLTASSLSLSNSTWYHVYAYLAAGVPSIEVVTTAPAAWKSGAYSKTGATSRRYIVSVKTNSSGSIYNFTHDPTQNLILYRKQQLNASPFRCLTTGTATTATAVPLSGVVPVTGTLAYVRAINTSDAVFYSSVDSSVSATDFNFSIAAGNVVQTTLLGYHHFDSSAQLWYKFSGAVGAGSGNLDVYGYTFSR